LPATAQAKATLAQANANLKTAEAELATAKANLKSAQDAETLAENVAREQHRLASEKAAQANGYHVAGNQVLDSHNQVVNGWRVVNGQMVDAYGNVIKVATNNTGLKPTANTATVTPVATTMSRVARKAAAGQQLPQTGDATDQSRGMFLLGLTAVFSLLGFAGYRRGKHAQD